ncbi:MAG: carbamoyl-phosphate synthase (glutamine-hydrolyzing) large subunit [Candidatus Levybacteria bacterium]|nr:carbamoyl-phosphate synthase (glutamine-hydrolyzing) large subunit [Candidatus Levybacteria bacterium]MBP9814784.1 carbamoyl-phosphate synthase (glutamine-hydrolyzing) large subunit [Candidatus Levybacteria bacterium]
MYKKILILGSGALKIGQAGEFDYSGSQAIKAFKETGIKTVLINPNIATIQTSEFLADTVYFLPVDEYFVEEVIKKEKPDAIALSFGGQTALNCGINLYKTGVFKKYKVSVLGTSIESIIISEDRDKFAKHLHSIYVNTPKSKAATSYQQANKIMHELGLPVMVRAGFALGGQKSGVCYTLEEFEEKVNIALAFSPQILVEQYLHHWKEIEYEVVRDKYDNCITVCNMENMDPLGIHTGESVVVAPSQTLTNYEYQSLRDISIKIVRSLNIIGECNVQFALNPHPNRTTEHTKHEDSPPLEYQVIELNPRLSRSSALASKATGYPLAYVAAKLVLGSPLTDIKNQVTHVTQSCFEPALDYIVVKIPRWDLEKFKGVEEKIGSSMKSVGEVMSIGRSFEEAFQKAIRMLGVGSEGITENNFPKTKRDFEYYLKTPTPKRMYAIAEAMKRKVTIQKIHNITGIDPWFLSGIYKIVSAEEKLKRKKTITEESLLEYKKLGISDKQIGKLIGKTELYVSTQRKNYNITPAILQIDTLAGEFPAQTNYLYTSYHATHNDVLPLGKQGVIVLGSGPYRIGSSVEFDWTCVNTALSLKKHDKSSIIVNCNPETVSTDYDVSDRLYFEELTHERISDIYDFEKSLGVIVSVGGQTPNNLVKKLENSKIKILGTKPVDIDTAEDRNKFSKLLDSLSIPQPEWGEVKTLQDAIKFANKVSYPVLIRPSYVLSGDAMSVCYTEDDLKIFTKRATLISPEHPITLSKFVEHAREIELDGVSQDGNILISAISQHLENAGVHSGDATIIYPPHELYIQYEKQIKDMGEKISKALSITGPFNIQFLARDKKVYVIEINLRASRTFPFISKATHINFAEKIVDAIFKKGTAKNIPYPSHYLVKSPQFSFSRLEGADPILKVEMASTGEAAAFGKTLEEAFLKSELSVGSVPPKKGIFVSLGSDDNKIRFLDSAIRLKKIGIPIYATEKTAKFLRFHKINATRLYKIHEKKNPNILSYFSKGKIDLAINIVDFKNKKDVDDGYIMRRAAIDHNIPLITNRKKADLFIKALVEKPKQELEIKHWSEYTFE